MVKISRKQWEELNKAGLLQHRVTKKGKTVSDPNYYVANKQHNGNAKTYYVVETPKIMIALGYLKPKPNYKPYVNNYKFR